MYQTYQRFFMNFLRHRAPSLYKLLESYKTIIKYGIAGFSVALIQLSLVYLFTSIFGIFYIISTIAAFSIALCLSFVVQKLWTFHDLSTDRIKRQFTIYLFLGALNFFLNPVLLYFFVTFLGLLYLEGQVLVIGILATESYIINKTITFKKEEKSQN